MKTCALLVASVLVLGGCGGSTESDGKSTGGSGGVTTGGGGVPSGGTGGVPTGGSGGVTSGGGSAGASTGGSSGTSSCGTCSSPADCLLVPSNCCICGMPELDDYVASSQAAAASCGCGGPVCQCASGINPNLAATCAGGACQGFDVSNVDAFSGCSSDSDCTLRTGLDCCEACNENAGQLVAVNVDQSALTKALCSDAPLTCPPCWPVYPANAKAICAAGHCQVASK